MQTVGHHEDDEEQMNIIAGLKKLLEPYNVLEVGCGHKRFASLFEHYVGIDSDYLMYPDFIVDVCAGKLDFTDKSFDMVLSVTTLMHNSDVRSALAEIARIAKRYIVLIEAYRWIGRARPHDYNFVGFDKILELRLTTLNSPLGLWLFKRR